MYSCEAHRLLFLVQATIALCVMEQNPDITLGEAAKKLAAEPVPAA